MIRSPWMSANAYPRNRLLLILHVLHENKREPYANVCYVSASHPLHATFSRGLPARQKRKTASERERSGEFIVVGLET